MAEPRPSSPDLEQLRKQAKDLLRAHQSGDPSAAPRIKSHLPKYAQRTESEILAAPLVLRDAQQVVAREHGFTSWQKLRAFAVPSAAAGAPAAGPGSGQQAGGDAVPYADADLLPVAVRDVLAYLHRHQPNYIAYLAPPETPGEDADHRAGSTVHLAPAGTPGESRDESKRMMITIGQFEGQALLMALRKTSLPRPLPHHLLQNLLGLFSGAVDSLVIHSIKSDVFYAHLRIRSQGRTTAMDCRPSGGMIVAVQNGAPIYVTQKLWQECAKPLEEPRAWRQQFLNEELQRWREEGCLAEREPDPTASMALGDVVSRAGMDGSGVLVLINQGIVKAFRAPADGQVYIEKQSLIEYLEKAGMPVPEALR